MHMCSSRLAGRFLTFVMPPCLAEMRAESKKQQEHARANSHHSLTVSQCFAGSILIPSCKQSQRPDHVNFGGTSGWDYRAGCPWGPALCGFGRAGHRSGRLQGSADPWGG